MRERCSQGSHPSLVADRSVVSKTSEKDSERDQEHVESRANAQRILTNSKKSKDSSCS